MSNGRPERLYGRRRALGLIAGAVGALPLAAAGLDRRKKGGGAMAGDARTTGTGGRMPVIFLAHGSPFLLDDSAWTGELRAWAASLPRPSAVLMLSAHWEARPITIGATRSVPLVYDFSGFPERFYRVKYPAPGAPALAARVYALLGESQPVAHDETRGLDHGAYVPLLPMYPDADIPVLQLSLPTLEPKPLLELGRALAPLREEGVLIVGSGFLSHNLRLMDWGPNPATPGWAREFDQWTEETLSRRDVDALLQYRQRAPAVRTALPTHEHFVPAIVAAGASIDRTEPVRFPITGFMGGSLTRRSVQFG